MRQRVMLGRNALRRVSRKYHTQSLAITFQSCMKVWHDLMAARAYLSSVLDRSREGKPNAISTGSNSVVVFKLQGSCI